MLSERRIALAVAWVLCLFASVACGATASFRGIGDLPGGQFNSKASAVSADGNTVVGWSVGASGTEAFRWTAATGMVGLGDLPEGAFESSATGVSADGTVIVGSGRTDTGVRPFRWENGVMENLGCLPGRTTGSQAQAVSADGRIVVGVSWLSGPGSEAFRWKSGVIAGLGTLANVGQTAATAISADGSVVVGYAGLSVSQGFRWQDGVMEELKDSSTGRTMGGFGISPDGSTVVGESAREAVLWRGGTIVGLGDIPGGKSYSTAYSVSASGDVVVGSGTSESGQEAMIWDAGHGMRSLHDVLTEEYNLDLTGWRLDLAMAVTPDGRTIVGFGTNPAGQAEGWIARTPEPTSLLLVALGGWLIRRPRRR